jgi:hypothetical protein
VHFTGAFYRPLTASPGGLIYRHPRASTGAFYRCILQALNSFPRSFYRLLGANSQQLPGDSKSPGLVPLHNVNLSSLPRYRRYPYLPDKEQRITRRCWFLNPPCLFLAVQIKPNRFVRAIPSEGLKRAQRAIGSLPHSLGLLGERRKGLPGSRVTKLSAPPSNENKEYHM